MIEQSNIDVLMAAGRAIGDGRGGKIRNKVHDRYEFDGHSTCMLENNSDKHSTHHEFVELWNLLVLDR